MIEPLLSCSATVLYSIHIFDQMSIEGPWAQFKWHMSTGPVCLEVTLVSLLQVLQVQYPWRSVLADQTGNAAGYGLMCLEHGLEEALIVSVRTGICACSLTLFALRCLPRQRCLALQLPLDPARFVPVAKNETPSRLRQQGLRERCGVCPHTAGSIA